MGLYQRKTWPAAGKAHVFDQAIRAAPALEVCFRETNVTSGMAGVRRLSRRLLPTSHGLVTAEQAYCVVH